MQASLVRIVRVPYYKLQGPFADQLNLQDLQESPESQRSVIERKESYGKRSLSVLPLVLKPDGHDLSSLHLFLVSFVFDHTVAEISLPS